MSQKKRKRWVMWVEKAKSPLAPEIHRLLPPLILELALTEDVTGPFCAQVVRDEYIARLSSRLREPVVQELHKVGIAVSDGQLAEICRLAASEAFVVRGLNEARLEGEISLGDLRHLPLYRTYRNYFEPTPDMVARAFGIAISAAAAVEADRCDAGKN
jgi:hypothetical protein